MGWIISALIWAAKNQATLQPIVQGLAALLRAYFELRRQLVATGSLTPSAAQQTDEALFAALEGEAHASGEMLDAQLARLRRQEPP